MAKHAVCKTNDIPVGSMKALKAGGANVVVYHLEDGFYATQASCTHVFAPLAKGKLLAGGRVQCPLHRAQFEVRTGECMQWANWPPGVQLLNVVRKEKPLKTYRVAVEGDQVFVEA